MKTLAEIKELLKDYDSFRLWLKENEGGQAGAVLNLVGNIRDLDGEDATDKECLYMISDLILMWRIEGEE